MQTEQKSMKVASFKRKQRLIFLKTAIILLILGVLASIALYLYVYLSTISSRSSAEVNIQTPTQVYIGETFDVVVNVRNIEEYSLTLFDITVDSSSDLNLLDGVEVVNINPPFSSYEEISNSHIYFFENQIISPNQTQTLIISFRALQAGTFNGIIFVDFIRDTEISHTKPEVLNITVSP